MDNKTLDHLSTCISPLFAHLGQDSFCTTLLELIRTEVACDSSVILLYRKGDQPKILFDRMSSAERQAVHDNYFNGIYLLSPYYLHWQAGASEDMVRLEDITPDGYFETVYYTDYYSGSGLIDEVGYLIPLTQDSAVMFLLSRTADLQPFTPAELGYLSALKKIIIAALRQHFTLSSLPPRTIMRVWLEDGLRLFGSSVLTERESQVVQLMLRGHSSKSCARELAISPTTERVHRRNIYAKLNIASQAELFRLFFDAMSEDHLPWQDPYQLLRHKS